MARKTLTQKLKEVEKENRRLQRGADNDQTHIRQLRVELAEKKAPQPKDRAANFARKTLRDLARIETILAEWNWVGQVGIVRLLKTVYDDVEEI